MELNTNSRQFFKKKLLQNLVYNINRISFAIGKER